MNFKLLIQYDGTDFHGWQVQENARSIQGELERVIGMLEDATVKVHGSGRTDAGVHAEGQVANVELQRKFTPEKLRSAINGNLSNDVRVLFVDVARNDFHARYSAKSKTYVYRIVHGKTTSPFWTRFAIHESRALDLKRLRSCAQMFWGEHDWSAFSSAQSDAESRVRPISSLEIDARWNSRGRCHLIEMSVTADGFLRYMVRSIVGTLLAVTRGEIDEQT